MLFIEDDNFLKQEHKDFIKNVILNCEFPFFIQQYTTEKDDETSGVLVHTLAKRLENRSQDEWLCSEYGHIFLDMAETFFKKIIYLIKLFIELPLILLIILALKDVQRI